MASTTDLPLGAGAGAVTVTCCIGWRLGSTTDLLHEGTGRWDCTSDSCRVGGCTTDLLHGGEEGRTLPLTCCTGEGVDSNTDPPYQAGGSTH